MLYLDDVHLNLLARELLEIAADVVDADAAFADDDAGLAGIHDHACLIGTTLDLDFRDRGGARHLAKVFSNRDVFVEPRLIILLFEPAAVPRARDAQPQTDWMNLLTHS